MRRVAPPATTDALEARAHALAGRTLAEIAAHLHAPVPADLRRHKGWVGQVIEAVLGAEGGSRPEPDFAALGVELKTIPVTRAGVPRESTFVCTVPTEGAFETRWEASHVRRKLAHVLWVPVAGESDEPPGARTIGTPRLWRPDAREDAVLAADWLALNELLVGGELHRISARLGRALQLRPKAANADDFAWMIGEDGDWVRAVPYGYYLRARFTAGVLGGPGVPPPDGGGPTAGRDGGGAAPGSTASG